MPFTRLYPRSIFTYQTCLLFKYFQLLLEALLLKITAQLQTSELFLTSVRAESPPNLLVHLMFMPDGTFLENMGIPQR